MIKLFDAHCHLQDSRVLNVAHKLIKEALETGVVQFSVNGVCEKDWHLVKEMGATYPSVLPNFGLHPSFISERSPDWLKTLKKFLTETPAAVGEIGIDKGSFGKKTDFTDQVQVFRQQLQLAKELQKPASIHCVCAFGELLEILKSEGPFPAGLVMHSFLGSAEMVPELSKLGAYFSFSGHLMSMKENEAKKILKAVPHERILLETDAPDARPGWVGSDSLFQVKTEDSESKEGIGVSEENCNHPANIHHVLSYVAKLLEMEERDVAELSYENAVRLFSFNGSKLVHS